MHTIRRLIVSCLCLLAAGWMAAVQAAPPVRIMPVGDSITYGSGSPGGGYRFPLWHLLTNAGYTVDFTGTRTTNGIAGLPDPDHEGWGGYRIDQIDASVAPPRLITLALGAIALMSSGNETGIQSPDNITIRSAGN